MEKYNPSMKLKDASKFSGLSYYALRKLCISKKVPSVKVGNAIYINMESLRAYLSGYGVNID